ncbi:MAG: sugar ABC transporter ATP-binding protein [Rhizobiales bacterium]|nr:sugar ABC transporter ATP-binding protein [Hyphomicrobiales bacterium]
MNASAEAPLLSASGISKRFGGVRALRDVAFDVRAGEVHGLIGANGAGKSTLINILSGAIAPDSGSLAVRGRPVPLGSVGEARRAGLAVVHQELMLFPDCTVEENIAATSLPTRGGFVDGRRRRRMVRRVLDSLGTSIDLSRRVAGLSLAERQLVEIGRALCGGGSIFVLDEPTSALSAPEAAGLFRTIGAIVEEDAGVVFVSHRLDEVFAITRRITVLRDGQVEGTWNTRDVDVRTITHAMVGDLADARPTRIESTGPVVLRARGASAPGVAPLDLDLRAGEVVGLAGLEGSGTSTVLEMLGGVIAATGGIVVGGSAARFRHPADAIRAGVVYMPPDRKRGGLWLDRSPLWNVAAAEINRAGSLAWLRFGTLRRAGNRRLDDVGVRAVDREQPVARFSGGNQQRVMLARLVGMGPKVMLLNDFTRGVDVKAKGAIHELVRGLAAEGVAICLTSTDLDELLEVADRIVCMHSGRQVASGPAASFTSLRLVSLVTTGSTLN